LASTAAFLYLIPAQCEWPDIPAPKKLRKNLLLRTKNDKIIIAFLPGKCNNPAVDMLYCSILLFLPDFDHYRRCYNTNKHEKRCRYRRLLAKNLEFAFSVVKYRFFASLRMTKRDLGTLASFFAVLLSVRF